MEKYKQIHEAFHPYERVMPVKLDDPRAQGICGGFRKNFDIENPPWNKISYEF